MFAIMPAGYEAETRYACDSYFDDQMHVTPAFLHRSRLSRIETFRKPGKLLDIGCAGGNFLQVARQRGWQVWGVELSGAMRKRAFEATGHPIFESIEQAAAGKQRFDCVTMFEVIEHLNDPVSTMRNVLGLLDPDGLLALSTPNCECPEAITGLPIDVWFIPPEHVSYFGPGTLSACLERAGFKMVARDGLEGFYRALAGDPALPSWITMVLRPFRRGKRLRPHGLLGKILKAAFGPSGRLDRYQRRHPADLARTDVLEFYARK